MLLSRQYSTVSSVGGESEADAPSAAAAADPLEWDLLSQRAFVQLLPHAHALRGRVELRVRLPSAPPLEKLRLNCGTHVQLDAVSVDGIRVAASLVERLDDAVVPARWRRTQTATRWEALPHFCAAALV